MELNLADFHHPFLSKPFLIGYFVPGFGLGPDDANMNTL